MWYHSPGVSGSTPEGTLEFHDDQAFVAAAGGVRLLRLGRRKQGDGSLVLRAQEAFALPQEGPLRLTVGASVTGAAAVCRTATSEYRSTRKGLRTE